MNDSTPVAVAPAQSLLNRFLGIAQRELVAVERELQTIGLSPTLYEALAQLKRAGRPLNLGELAAGQRCAPSNITQKMDRLEREGLVRRIGDPADRRGILAEITPEGRERADAGEELVRRLALAFEAAVPEAERESFARALQALD